MVSNSDIIDIGNILTVADPLGETYKKGIFHSKKKKKESWIPWKDIKNDDFDNIEL